ncbi:hypothetical protein [Saccharothrix texasensis]|uniref:Uncharacterized protein n=1 Tax=Saccharothrix texasensis TaxID=103734 RepID=A0A3N1HF36_9PSEU|nr:hypothetical protein [Saccharothrix texasensis]ROP41134.1 hypothetical protein EDD40_6559 [Saccharothrix texasensis]
MDEPTTPEDEPTTPVAGMTISLRTGRDVVIVDPDRFLAAARAAHHDLHPDLTEAEVAEAIADVTDAAYALIDRHGDLAADHEPPDRPPLPGVRVTDRPDGLSPAGSMSELVLDEPHPLQDYGCFLPDDVFARRPDH